MDNVYSQPLYLLINNIFECIKLPHFKMQNLNNPESNAFIMTYGQVLNICPLSYVYRNRTFTINIFAYVLPVINTSKVTLIGAL